MTLRMADMRKECSGIGKTDILMTPKEGKPFTIKGHTVEAVLAELRPMLDRHGLGLIPNLVERAYTGNRCDVIVDWEFEGLDLGDTKVVRWAGAGTDNGDKGFSKAGTNSLKEMLKKTFLITDRADAKEEEEQVEHQTDDAIQRQKLAVSEERRKAAVAKGLNSLKAAIEKATEESEVDRLRRDNRELLDESDLPDVTRSFFIDLMASRKAEIAQIAAERAEDFPGDRT